MVYGDDFKTKDGTGVRDYIHVVRSALSIRLTAVAVDCSISCSVY